MNTELLKNIYKAIDWATLYELMPEVKRDDVDLLFKELNAPAGEKTVKTNMAGDGKASHSAPETAVLYCDGASSGNPGPSGIGIVIENTSGSELAAWGEHIGKSTNNAAEYTALIRGLEKALEMGVKKVEVRTDSQLMERQLVGIYRVKSASLKPLFEKAASLLRDFENWAVNHIDREYNKKADKLASGYAKKN